MLLTQAVYIGEIIELTGQSESTQLPTPMSESDPSFIVVNDDSIDDKKHVGCIKLDAKEHHK